MNVACKTRRRNMPSQSGMSSFAKADPEHGGHGGLENLETKGKIYCHRKASKSHIKTVYCSHAHSMGTKLP